MDDNIFTEKQTKLQKQATGVLSSLDLVNTLLKYGEVKMVGSVALGLMTWPDIDIDLESNSEINDKDYFEIVKYIFSQKNIKQLKLIDNRNSFEKNRPKSMYIAVIYNLNGVEWKIDIRYLNSGDAFAEDYLNKIKSKLTEEKITAILKIKTDFCNHHKYRKEFSGFEIYNAVLDENIYSIEDFRKYMLKKGVEL
jgi:hypothetical protein